MTNPDNGARLRFSANLSLLFKELEPLERIEAAARAGFDGVEWQFPFDLPRAELYSRCKNNGVTCNHINTPMGEAGMFGLAAQPGFEDAFARALDLALEYATALGCLTIHCMSGVVAPAVRAKARHTFLHNMERAGKLAQSAGVTLCLEPINTRDRPGYFISHSDETALLLDEIDNSHVKLLFDFYHIQIMEGDLFARLEKHWNRIGHIQIASVPKRNEPDCGEFDCFNIFTELQRRGWQGFIGAEYTPAGATLDGLGWLNKAKANRL